MSLDEYQRRKRVLRESEGARLQSDLDTLRRSLRVFLGNCEELLRFLSFTDTPEDQVALMELWDTENREAFDRFLDEAERLLHNVLAAAMSLKEHSIRVRDKWLRPDENDTLRAEYDQRATTIFVESKAARFIAGVRNIVQHRKLPRLLGGLSWTRGEPVESEVRFDPDDLLQWEGWSADMREYLQEFGDTIDLAEVVTEYRDAAVEFHDWFADAVRERNKSALQEFEVGRQELAAYGSTLFGPAINDPQSD